MRTKLVAAAIPAALVFGGVVACKDSGTHHTTVVHHVPAPVHTTVKHHVVVVHPKTTKPRRVTVRIRRH